MTWARTSRHTRGYGSHWDKLRKRILERDKHLCQQCLSNGRITAGNQVDHKTPKAKGGTDAEDNLWCLCLPCHQAKTTTENGGRPRMTFGADGWPV